MRLNPISVFFKKAWSFIVALGVIASLIGVAPIVKNYFQGQKTTEPSLAEKDSVIQRIDTVKVFVQQTKKAPTPEQKPSTDETKPPAEEPKVSEPLKQDSIEDNSKNSLKKFHEKEENEKEQFYKKMEDERKRFYEMYE